ncbi:MAG: RdgB/HAM1 family non-canonical purine NTP pyrophosphatase [Chloroflexi bacterium]|nr:RdgB/HAM1 family non-canonical purine NTP pyrophosphatase [Chloroflexota bacterium]
MNQSLTTLLLATNNKGKIQELQSLLGTLPLRLATPAGIGLSLEVAEDGLTYAENAAKKAAAFCLASRLPALADDSGLEVEALGGRPGLHSNRFGPQPGSDTSRRRFLLEQLADKPRPWQARFRATVALAVPGMEVQLAAGECAGEIIPQERGTGGFGYDPLFLFTDLGRTMAELGMEEKNRLSHRARAVENAIPILVRILGL